MSKYDDSQTKYFNEELIFVDENDEFVKGISKLNAHLIENKNKYPHRAFSLFLFDKHNRLLLQKRSDKKVTFPHLWSNTCCSHPLISEIEKKNHIGIRQAAQRRLKFELNINIDVDKLYPIEKILYRANSDDVFEEFEMDYIILGSLENDIFEYNIDEVEDVQFLEANKINTFVNNNKITPWFELLVNSKLEEYFKINKKELKIDNKLKFLNFCL